MVAHTPAGRWQIEKAFRALHFTIQRHEATFGALETDVQRRVQPGAMRQSQPPA